MAELKIVGKSVPRNDGWAKATGNAMFTHDMYEPGMLCAKILRSPHSHARIISIDTSAAEALPGVKAVATYKNTSRTFYTTSAGMWFHKQTVRDQLSFDEFVRYVGDEVAAVAATSERIAERACRLIKVEYEILPSIFDAKDALKEDAPLVHTEYRGVDFETILQGDANTVAESNVVPYSSACFTQGDFETAWAGGEVFSEIYVKLPVQKQCQLETHAALAHFHGDGRLEVCSTTQNPYPVKMTLACIFGLQENKVRVYNPPYIGGGFGSRLGLSAKAEPIAAELSRLSGGRPVKLVYSRAEDFTCSDTRHGGYVACRLAAKNDGTLIAIQGRALLNSGAYASYSIGVPAVLALNSLATYSIHNIDYRVKSSYTNLQPAGAMRGFGTPQGVFALEAAIDDIARQINMDPVEIRKKNIRTVNDEWFLPYPVSSTSLMECIDKVTEEIKWKEKHGKKQNGSVRNGVGIGIGAHGSNSFPTIDYSCIEMRLESDGTVLIGTCIPEMGTGDSTTLAQVAAETIGVPYKNIRVAFGDTETGLWECGSYASRTMYSVGLIAIKAGTELRNLILKYTAENFFNSEPDTLELTDGVVKGFGKEIPLPDIALHAHLNNTRFNITLTNRPGNATPWVAQTVEVEVDTETGKVTLLKIVAANDCGIAVNPQIVEGQMQGGIAMGLGYGLHEEMLYDKNGSNISGSFHKYMMPTIKDIPEMKTFIIESDDPSGPYGAKSVGECAMVPTAAAIASAVEDAIGIRFNEIPLTPQRVLQGIKNGY